MSESQAQTQYLQVRIWYTIDGSSQYILARSPDKFPVHPLGASSSHRSTYATTSLKLCLHSICRSSPELMHFGQRDFSIYALDPSESDSAPNTVVVSSGSGSSSSQPTSAPQQPPGVAVGMGLMSWALAAPDDSACVTGIMNKTASGDSALEVVFALRGTLHAQQPPVFQPGCQGANPWQPQMPMQAPMHMPPAAYPIHLNQSFHITDSATSLDMKQPLKSSDLYADSLRRDRRRKPVPRSSSGHVNKKNPHSHLHPLIRAARGLPVKSQPQDDEKLPKFKDPSQSVAPSGISNNLDLSDSGVRAALSTLLSPYQNQTASSQTSSKLTSPRSTKAINTLLQLFGKPTQQPTDTSSDFAPTPESSQISTAPETTDSDDEIIILEKENVDPGTFKRGNGHKPNVSAASASENTPKRKRTLSDVAEAQRRPKRHCDSSPPRRKLTFLSRPLLSDPVTYPSKPLSTQTPRPNADLFAARSALVAAAFLSPPKTAHAAPAKATLKADTLAPTSNSTPAPAVIKKPYVVPEWARTTTGTKPRISADALARREAENAREQAKALERKLANRRKSRGRAAAEQQPSSTVTQPASVRPSSASTPPRRVSLGNSNASVGTSTAAPIMAAAADVFRSSSPPPQVSTSSPTTAVPVPDIVPCTPTRRPASASFHSSDPTTSLSPAIFSASGSPLFSPEAGDYDDGNTLKLAKAMHVYSPIQSVLSGRGVEIGRPASPLRCKNSEVGTRMDTSEPAVAGTSMSTREDGDASVETPEDSLPAASDDDDETGLEGGSTPEKEHRGVSELDFDDDGDEEEDHETVAQRLLWSDSLPPSSPLLSSSDAFSDGLDLDFGHVDSCTSEPPRESPPQQQAMSNVDGSKDTPNANVDPDSKEMVAFWSSIEAFLTSSSSDSTVTVTAEGAGATEGEEDFSQLWGKGWTVEAADAGSPVVDLFTNTGDMLRAEDILQQDIFA